MADNSTTIWVVSESNEPETALYGSNVVQYVSGGENPRKDADQIAREYAAANGVDTFLYRVDLTIANGYRREVVKFDPTKP